MQRLVRALDWDLREGRCASTVSENTVEVMTFEGSMTMRIEFKTLTYNADAEACEDGRALVLLAGSSWFCLVGRWYA